MTEVQFSSVMSKAQNGKILKNFIIYNKILMRKKFEIFIIDQKNSITSGFSPTILELEYQSVPVICTSIRGNTKKEIFHAL